MKFEVWLSNNIDNKIQLKSNDFINNLQLCTMDIDREMCYEAYICFTYSLGTLGQVKRPLITSHG